MVIGPVNLYHESPKGMDGNDRWIMICCICGDVIASDEKSAIKIRVENIRSSSRNAPWQELYAHGYCFERVLHSSVPFDAEALAD